MKLHRALPIVLLSLLSAACGAEDSATPAGTGGPAVNAAPAPATVAQADVQPPPYASAANPAPYTELRNPQPTSAPGKIEVVEIFLYTCPHCYAFEPRLAEWRKRLPEDVVFVRVPASFGPNGTLLAKAYYAAEELGVLEKLHPAIFDAFHRQRRPLNNENDMVQLFAENGVKEADFRSAFGGFGVDSKVRRAAQLEVGYGVTGVPAMAVNGKYSVSISRAGGPDGMLRTVDELVQKERAAGAKP